MPPTDTTFAFNVADFQLDPVSERFFNQSHAEHEDSVLRPALLAPTQRRAMRATFGMLGVFLLALALFLVYARVIMPVPAPLDADRLQAELP